MRSLKQADEILKGGKKRLKAHGSRNRIIQKSKKRTAFNLKMLGIES